MKEGGLGYTGAVRRMRVSGVLGFWDGRGWMEGRKEGRGESHGWE